ncbi:unnamed protein product [Ixodes persulcatus]
MASAQQTDRELQNLCSAPGGLEFRMVALPMCDMELLCDISTGTPRPYVPEPYRRKLFDTLHKICLALHQPGCPGVNKGLASVPTLQGSPAHSHAPSKLPTAGQEIRACAPRYRRTSSTIRRLHISAHYGGSIYTLARSRPNH